MYKLIVEKLLFVPVHFTGVGLIRFCFDITHIKTLHERYTVIISKLTEYRVVHSIAIFKDKIINVSFVCIDVKNTYTYTDIPR